MVVLFSMNSMLTSNNLDLRRPSIFQLTNAENHENDVNAPGFANPNIPTQATYSNGTTHTTIESLKGETTVPVNFKDVAEPKSMSFMLQSFPWNELEEGAENNQPLYLKHRQSLIDKIEKFAYLEPNDPINSSCRPPDLINSSMINCEKYPAAFLPDKFNESVKIGHAIQLGFDVDTLEIHLNEIYDVVDYFFIIEATRIHCESFRKQLTWDQVNTQTRFNKFRDKGKSRLKNNNLYFKIELCCTINL